jgi:PAS domain S-box-containing protein
MKNIVTSVGIQIVIYTIVYIFAHQVAFFFPGTRSFTMMIWPAGGIALAALILNPYRLWYYYIPVFFVTGVAADMFLAHIPFSASIGFMSANILESTFCALLFRKFCKSSVIDFTRIQELLCLIAGAFIVNAFTSLIGAVTSVYFSRTSFTDAWVFWYIADLLGILLITPFIVSVVRIKQYLKHLTMKNANESIAFLIFWIFSCLSIFVFPVAADIPLGPHPYMLIALLLWPAFRLRLPIVSLALIGLSIIAFTGNTSNHVYILETNYNETNSIYHLQVFLAFTAIIGYFFSASNSERRITEEKNRESEKRYKNLFDQTNEGLMIMSTNLIILEVNDSFARMHGYPISKLIGQHISFIDATMSPGKPINPDIINILKNNSAVYFDVNHRHADGHIFTVRIRSSIIQIGNESFYLTFHHDITEQRKMEEALKERTQFTESLLKISPDGIYIFDLVKKSSVYSNDGVIHILGYTSDEVKKMNTLLLPKLMHPDDYEEYLTTTMKKYATLKDNEILSTHFRMLHKDRHYRWVLANEIVYRRLDNGEPEQIFGIIHDITNLKEKERQLEERDFFFRESQKSASIGSYRLYITEDRWEASEGLFQIFGIDATYPCTTQGWLKLVHPEDVDIVGKYLSEEVIGKQKPFDKEYRIVRENDHEIRWIHGQGIVELDNDGRPIYMVGTIQDITDRKKTEGIIQNAQKLESLGILAGGIAHDFNNLMGGIFGYIDIAIGNSNDEKVTKYLTKAIGTIDRAKSLTAQLLTFSKGGAPVQKVMSLFPIIEDTIQFTLSGSNVSSVYKIATDLWNCNIDINQISQVFDNIVINAIQAMPSGGEITVTASNTVVQESKNPLLSNGNYVKISIEDHGVGIKKENLNKLFVPFYSTKPSGHGLGLATSYSIMHRHGGTIDVESEVGKGSVFHIYIPATLAASDHLIIQGDSNHRKGTILIMDDEEVMRETISVMLEKIGYSCICANDSFQAVGLFKKAFSENQQITGIILDLTIPGGIGGRETLIEIRKIDKEIPVFAVSGYADDPIMKDPSQSGFSGSLCKPFRKSELIDMLKMCLPMQE